jgi:hypothetical protein
MMFGLNMQQSWFTFGVTLQQGLLIAGATLLVFGLLIWLKSLVTLWKFGTAPCPFCRSIPLDDEGAITIVCTEGMHQVACSHCGALGPLVDWTEIASQEDSCKAAIDLWNERS